jgi:hypothetical protein
MDDRIVEEYEFKGFKLGQEIIYKDKVVKIIGFDENDTSLFVAIEDDAYKEELIRSVHATKILKNSETKSCIWVRAREIFTELKNAQTTQEEPTTTQSIVQQAVEQEKARATKIHGLYKNYNEKCGVYAEEFIELWEEIDKIKAEPPIFMQYIKMIKDNNLDKLKKWEDEQIKRISQLAEEAIQVLSSLEKEVG